MHYKPSHRQRALSEPLFRHKIKVKFFIPKWLEASQLKQGHMRSCGSLARAAPPPISAQRLIAPSASDPALVPSVVEHPHLKLWLIIPPSPPRHQGSAYVLLNLCVTPNCYFCSGSAYGLLKGWQPHNPRHCKSSEPKVSSHPQRQVGLHPLTVVVSKASGGPSKPLTQPERNSQQLTLHNWRWEVGFCWSKTKNHFLKKKKKKK